MTPVESSLDCQRAKVVFLSVFAAMAYGVIHDQITAHVCVEYFTIAHPPLFHTRSPTMLGFCWGVFATIGLGAVLGSLLASVSQSEGLPPFPIIHLVHSILILLAAMALTALLSGILGFELSRHSIIALPNSFADLIRQDRRDRFMAVWFAHGASYLAGLTGGAILVLQIWHQRGKPRVLQVIPRTKLAITRALVLVTLVAIILYMRFTHF